MDDITYAKRLMHKQNKNHNTTFFLRIFFIKSSSLFIYPQSPDMHTNIMLKRFSFPIDKYNKRENGFVFIRLTVYIQGEVNVVNHNLFIFFLSSSHNKEYMKFSLIFSFKTHQHNVKLISSK